MTFKQYTDKCSFENLQNEYESSLQMVQYLQEDLERSEKEILDKKAHFNMIKSMCFVLDLELSQQKRKMLIDKTFPKFVISFFDEKEQKIIGKDFSTYSMHDGDVIFDIAEHIKNQQGYNSYKIVKIVNGEETTID